MRTILNIGLLRSEASQVAPKAPLNVAVLMDCVKALWGRAAQAYVHTSDTEPTLVIDVSAPVSTGQVERLSKAFDQDAIAFFDTHTGRGFLAGPRASAWGNFNPEYFLLPNGDRLAQAASAA